MFFKIISKVYHLWYTTGCEYQNVLNMHVFTASEWWIHDRFAIYSHALIATGLDRTKLSTTPYNIPQVILFSPTKKYVDWWKQIQETTLYIYIYYFTVLKHPPSWHGIYIRIPFLSIKLGFVASGNCFAAHWATSAKGGATSMEATWNHGNHGSHGTKARMTACKSWQLVRLERLNDLPSS